MSEHKELVDAIIDGEVDAVAIAEKAMKSGAPFAAQLNRITRAILTARAEGRLTPEKAEAAYKEVYKAIALAGFVHVADAVQSHGEQVAGAVHKASKKLGSKVLSAPVVRKADFMARELEKRGIKDGDLTPEAAPTNSTPAQGTGASASPQKPDQ